MAELAAPLLYLFGAAFLASTLVPLPSEAALFAYLSAYPENAALGVAVATIGNTAGGMTSYAIGRLVPQKKLHQLETVKRYGPPVLLLAWLPLVGDALCVAAGWLRMRWPVALAFMAAGRLARYLAVAFIS
jgi:membrane protein YqaA with SNARE-associated domain